MRGVAKYSRVLVAARKAFAARPQMQLAAAQIVSAQPPAATAVAPPTMSHTIEESLWQIEMALEAGELEATRGMRYMRKEIEELAMREAEYALEELRGDDLADFTVSSL